ncbi:hypothetical protein [Spirosoma spitsbergense]|uniref:hypothetical protein n=1 Tax=Spirosoma spitsbergense TaxID=431554 RepID=UPI0012FA8406|nr:hypothetical protein [Spirosoma spitsbergense]
MLNLNQGYNSLYQAYDSKPEFLLYSFLDFYKIVEVLGKELIKGNNRTAYTITDSRRSGFRQIPFISFSPAIQSHIYPTMNGSVVNSYRDASYTPTTDDRKYYDSPTSSLRFSGLMLLRFGMSEADTVAFLRLNRLRNDLTHEGNTSSRVVSTDVMEILRLIKKAFEKI